jgi:hypothetical protein
MDAINTALGGIQKASYNIGKAANNIADPAKQNNMVEDIVDIKTNEIAFKANVSILKTIDETQNELLKIFDKEV